MTILLPCDCPPEEHSTSSKETFYRTLHRAIQKMRKEHPSYKIIAAGDFNPTFGQDILNTMFATRSNEHRWSFHSNLGYKHRLDYIMTDWYEKHATTNCRVYPKPNFCLWPSDCSHDCCFPNGKRSAKDFPKIQISSYETEYYKIKGWHWDLGKVQCKTRCPVTTERRKGRK